MLSFIEYTNSSFFFDESFYDYISEGFETSNELYQNLQEKAKSSSNGDQPWAKTEGGHPSRDWEEKDVKNWVETNVMPVVAKSKKEYVRSMKKIANSFKGGKAIIAPDKTSTSILSKLKRGKDINRMHDILRGTILVKEPTDVAKVHELVRKTFKIFEVETKTFGGDPDFGYYGSVHYKVELSSGHIAEIQVMPRALKATKDLAHDIYNQEREKVANDPNYTSSPEFKRQQKLSRDLFRRGSGNKKVSIK